MNAANRPPDWLGIGGQRSGTSWLIANLHEHPAISAPTDQINYFHRDDHYGQGAGWYAKNWLDAEGDQLVGECSCAYLYSEVARQRIKSDLPDVRLFMSARNPVMRTRSALRLAMMEGRLDPGTSMRDALDNHPDALEFSLYGKYAERYVDAFSRDRLHIAVLDFDNPDSFDSDPPLASLYRFLGVDEDFRSQFANRSIGHGYVPRSVLLERLMLNASRFLSSSGMRHIRWSIKASGLPGLVRRFNDRTGNADGADFSLDDIRFLLDRLQGDIDRLQALVDEDLEALWVTPLLSGR